MHKKISSSSFYSPFFSSLLYNGGNWTIQFCEVFLSSFCTSPPPFQRVVGKGGKGVPAIAVKVFPPPPLSLGRWVRDLLECLDERELRRKWQDHEKPTFQLFLFMGGTSAYVVSLNAHVSLRSDLALENMGGGGICAYTTAVLLYISPLIRLKYFSFGDDNPPFPHNLTRFPFFVHSLPVHLKRPKVVFSDPHFICCTLLAIFDSDNISGTRTTANNNNITELFDAVASLLVNGIDNIIFLQKINHFFTFPPNLAFWACGDFDAPTFLFIVLFFTDLFLPNHCVCVCALFYYISHAVPFTAAVSCPGLN